jgi:hypothetical protein
VPPLAVGSMSDSGSELSALGGNGTRVVARVLIGAGFYLGGLSAWAWEAREELGYDQTAKP